MTLPDALALRRRLASTPRPQYVRWGSEQWAYETLPPFAYVVRRSAKRSLRVRPFYVAVDRNAPRKQADPAEARPARDAPSSSTHGKA